MGLISKHLSSVGETENRICALPDDLLLQILGCVPTKDAVATTILCKRWRFVWTMLPELVFEEQGSESLGHWLVDKALELHNSEKLSKLDVELGPCSVEVDVGEWVKKAVKGGVEELYFKLRWNKGDPTSFPKSLYTCDTLFALTLSNEILVDVPSPARLPSLSNLTLEYVVYKDQDSLVKLLSSCPVLKWLYVLRHEDDNLTNITFKVSSLESLAYKACARCEDEVEVEVEDEDDDNLNGSLVIDSPALTGLTLFDSLADYCLIENMPCLDVAYIDAADNLSDKFMTSLSSAIHLDLFLTESKVACCYNAINFSRLIEFYFTPENSLDWLDPLMLLLQYFPILKSLTINTNTGVVPPSWNQPNSIPGCLSSHLDFFGWRGYQGREDEKQLVTYILANSKCLKTVEISFIPPSNLEERQKEIESIPRISTSSELRFPAKMNCFMPSPFQ